MKAGQAGDWYLGIDLGTGSCKTVIIDQRANVLGHGASDYVSPGSHSSWQEQDPKSLLSAVVKAVRQAVDHAPVRADACRGMSVGGAYHSLMAIDRHGEPLTGVMTWIDERPSKVTTQIRKSIDPQALYLQTGCPVHSLYPLYKLIWLREEKTEIFDHAWRFISAKEYLLAQLTGEYLLDFGIAAGTGLLNATTLDWNPLSLELAGISATRLSPLLDPRHSVGSLKPELAAEMGIPYDTPLILGSADAVNSSLGAGAVSSGMATCMIGTSGAIRIVARKPMLDTQSRTWCYAIDPEHWLVGGAINNGGLALTWLRDAISRAFPTQFSEEEFSYEEIIELAGQVPAGAEGLICLPFFAGERSPNWNMQASGGFFGLTLRHDMRHLARALLEGVAFRLRSVKEALVEAGAEIREMRASGGFTHSTIWSQITSNAMNQDLSVLEWGETSSLGAAFWALLGTGVVNSVEEFYPLVRVSGQIHPDPEESRIYNRLYEIYNHLYHQVKDSFESLSEFKSIQSDEMISCVEISNIS